MELFNKLKYEAPTSETVKIQMEGVLCGSKMGSETISLMILIGQPDGLGNFGDSWSWE